MEKPLITVIVPVYNVSKYLVGCLESVMRQTYTNLEIILVDDGSTDDSAEICDRIALQDARIQVIHKPNGGLSSARNAGIDAAHGDILSFIDADDHIDPFMIEKMLFALTENDADLCICNLNYVEDGTGHVLQQWNDLSPLENECFDRDAAMDKLVKQGYWFYVTAVNKLYKKELFHHLRFSNGKYHEDEFIIHRIFQRCERIVSVDSPFYHYVQRQGSIMNSRYSLKNLDGIEARIDRIAFFIENHYFAPAVETLNITVDSLLKASFELSEEGASRIACLKSECKKLYKTLRKKTKVPFKKSLKFYMFFSNSRFFKAYLENRYRSLCVRE